MNKTRNRLQDYWDEIILSKIPSHAHFKKVEDELAEHTSLLLWAWKRFLLPLVIIYIVLAFTFKVHIGSAIIVALLVFIYSSFLTDSDVLVRKAEKGERIALWYELYFLLFFAPIFLYYVVQGKAAPLYAEETKPFHSAKTIFIWGAFLLVVGSLLYPDNNLNRFMLPLFGMAGMSFHLMVDGIVHFFWLKNRPAYPFVTPPEETPVEKKED